MKQLTKQLLCLILVFAPLSVLAQRKAIIDSPERKEFEGPYTQLIIRNATLIEGSLAPPIKPVHIVIENGRIKSIHLINAVGSSAYSRDVPKLKEGGRIDCAAVVNSAGYHARTIAGYAGIDLPVHPRKRYVYVFD